MARNLRRILGMWVFATLLHALPGCGGDPVAFDLVFPSEETFLISSTATISIYAPTEETPPDVICRNLSAGLPAIVSPESSSGAVSVCQIDELQLSAPAGRVVMFAEVSGGVDNTTKLMSGCTVADVFADTEGPVRIQLSTLPDYPEDPNVLCADRTAKCEGLESCL